MTADIVFASVAVYATGTARSLVRVAATVPVVAGATRSRTIESSAAAFAFSVLPAASVAREARW